MLKRILATGAIALALLVSPFLSGCTSDGQLKPDARAKLETVSQWVHRGAAGAKLVIVGITATCEGKTSKFCVGAMPFVLLADGALSLVNSALSVGDAALADPGTPEEKLANAAANLIKLEQNLEDYIGKIKTPNI